ncbi:MAG: RlmF-related methyltransferase [Nonlabens sp.]
MHHRNLHRYGYDFAKLAEVFPELSNHIILTTDESKSIDFSNFESVRVFNQALMAHHYGIKHWRLPQDALIPAVPGRAEYLHQLSDLIGKGGKKGLDVGCGASAVYCLLGSAIYDYKMVGVDVDDESIAFAKKNTSTYNGIEIRHQIDRGQILEGVMREGEFFDFTMCNPPFYESEEKAIKANRKKNSNLGIKSSDRNFGGLAHELWCNGGESLFIKRMIKESVAVKDQVGWFTCLLSRKQHLDKPVKQLKKLKAEHKTASIEVGNKEMHLLAWKFQS